METPGQQVENRLLLLVIFTVQALIALDGLNILTGLACAILMGGAVVPVNRIWGYKHPERYLVYILVTWISPFVFAYAVSRLVSGGLSQLEQVIALVGCVHFLAWVVIILAKK